MNLTIVPPIRLRLFLLVLAITTAILITLLPYSVTLIIFFAFFIGIIYFLYPKIAFYILIFSMLFSPELIMGYTGAREITFRLDDLLLFVITLTWLVRGAVYKELAVFYTTPLHGPIALFAAISLLSTLIGMAFGRVGFASLLFFIC